MKKSNQIIVFTLILLMCITMIFPSTKVYAAASASLNPSKTTIDVGETINITVSVNAAETWNLKVTSDGGNLSGTMQDADAAGSEVSKQVISGNFTANAAGTYKITLSGEIAGSDLKKQSVSKTVTITVKSKETTPTENDEKDIPQETPVTSNTTTKSSNNYLSSLKVNNGTLSPEFNSRTYKYTVNVEKEVESIKITASAEHNKAKVSGTGTKTLKEGDNTINVKVTAEDGKVRTYTIVVNKPQEEVKVGLKSLLIKGVKSEEETIDLTYTPEFSSEVYEYQLLLDETMSDITKLNIEAIGLQENFTVEINGNEDLQEGENIITITVKSEDGETTITYKIIVTKEAKVVPISAPIVEVEQEVIKPLWNRTQQILITICTSIITIMGIAFAVIEYRYKKDDEENLEIPYSGINSESEETKEEDKVEEIPFAKIGFEKESDETDDKVDVLKEEKEFKDIKTQKEEIEEELRRQSKPKKGKHF